MGVSSSRSALYLCIEKSVIRLLYLFVCVFFDLFLSFFFYKTSLDSFLNNLCRSEKNRFWNILNFSMFIHFEVHWGFMRISPDSSCVSSATACAFLFVLLNYVHGRRAYFEFPAITCLVVSVICSPAFFRHLS